MVMNSQGFFSPELKQEEGKFSSIITSRGRSLSRSPIEGVSHFCGIDRRPTAEAGREAWTGLSLSASGEN